MRQRLASTVCVCSTVNGVQLYVLVSVWWHRLLRCHQTIYVLSLHHCNLLWLHKTNVTAPPNPLPVSKLNNILVYAVVA